MTFTAGETLTAAALNTATKKIVARGSRATSSTTTTSTQGVLRLDDIPITGGRAYRIWTSPLALDSSVNNDIIGVHIRYTTDGSTPSTSSTQLPGSFIQQLQANAAQSENVPINCLYVPGADETLSLLLCVTRVSGTGNALIFADSSRTIDLVVEDIGVDPGDTGVDI